MQNRLDWIINYKKILISILFFNRKCIFFSSFFLYECTCMSQYTYACNLCKYMTYIVSYISWYIVSVFAFVKYFVQLLNVTMKINYISQNGKATKNNSMNRRTYKNSATNSQRIDIRHVVAPLYRLTSSFRIRYFIFVIFPFYIWHSYPI